MKVSYEIKGGYSITEYDVQNYPPSEVTVVCRFNGFTTRLNLGDVFMKPRNYRVL